MKSNGDSILRAIISNGDTSTSTNRNHSSNPKESQLVDQLRSMLDSNVFQQVAFETLETVDNPYILAECAHLVGEREHGGLYYQARFWRKAILVQTHEDADKSSLEEFYKKQRLSRRDIRKIAEFGKQLEAIENESQTEALQKASNKILNIAARQNGSVIAYLEHASDQLIKDPNFTTTQIHTKWCASNGSIKANLDIIKPSDWWAFSHPKWRKQADFDGSIPGEIYANALYYFAPQKGIAADAMAGSGMLKRVYDDRKLWQKDSNFDLEIQLFDLNPKRKFIKRHDARYPLPNLVDWIFLDPPYFGQSRHLFTGALSETQDPESYLKLIGNVIAAMSKSLKPGGRLCMLLPKWSGQVLGDPNFDMPRLVCTIAEEHELNWIDTAYVSRGRQQELGSALKNISAKQLRRMRSDSCVLNVFKKEDDI